MSELVTQDAIELAKRVGDVDSLREWREQADAVQLYGRRTENRELANAAGEAKVRCEAALGWIDNEAAPLGTNQYEGLTGMSDPPLRGMREGTRATWRKLGKLDDETLAAAIAKARDEEDDAVTTASVLGFIVRSAPPRQPEDTPALPVGTYRTIVIDPPWPMPQIVRKRRAAQDAQVAYATMSLDEIAELAVPDLFAPAGAHIYLWVTHSFLPAGLDILQRWGARYECALTWVKNVGITPFSWMYTTEHVLFARAGQALDLEQKGLRLDFSAPATGHSIKPDAFYERVREASPEPRLEMFTRQPHEGFEPWGAEVPDAI